MYGEDECRIYGEMATALTKIATALTLLAEIEAKRLEIQHGILRDQLPK